MQSGGFNGHLVVISRLDHEINPVLDFDVFKLYTLLHNYLQIV